MSDGPAPPVTRIRDGHFHRYNCGSCAHVQRKHPGGSLAFARDQAAVLKSLALLCTESTLDQGTAVELQMFNASGRRSQQQQLKYQQGTNQKNIATNITHHNSNHNSYTHDLLKNLIYS